MKIQAVHGRTRLGGGLSGIHKISASDVNELSTAMSKTASIAASAGSSFENTSAFLAQMIETTREAPDAIGTSLKTVVARFTELKKAPSEIGEVDGEIVDANAIETALRSVGIALRDEVTGQLRDFDDIILELAAKWGTLDSNTQHYIATVSAGSRQQSRFLALLSDYDRLLELTAAAEGAAGASNEQYQKTLESLDSKLNALTNAWDTFVMGIADDSAVKFFVDVGTAAINATNSFTELFGSLGGVAKIGIMAGAMKVGSTVVREFAISLKNTSDISKSLGVALKNTGKSAKNSISKLGKVFKGGNLGDLSEITKATAARTAAEQELAAVQTRINEAVKQGAYVDENKIVLDKAKAEATKKCAAAEAAEAAARKLSVEQQKESIAMQALGIKSDTAELFAKQGITAKNVELAASTYGVAVSEVTEEQARSAATATLFQKIAATTGSTIATWAEKAATDESTVSTTLHKLAQDALNGSLGATLFLLTPLLIGLAALAATIILVVKLLQDFQANLPEAKLERAREATQAATDAANAAAEAYDELNDSLSGLFDKYSILKNMTIGTDKWKEATEEINDEVSKLVEQYQELANYVTYKDGVMVIDISSPEVQAVLEKYKDQENYAKIASQASKYRELEYTTAANIQTSKLGSKASEDAIWSGVAAGSLLVVGGAATGAAGGSIIAPGPGTIIGAIIGGLGGLVGTVSLGIEEYNDLLSKYTESAEIMATNKVKQDENGRWVLSDDVSNGEDYLDALKQLNSYSEEEIEELKKQANNQREVLQNQKAINEILRHQIVDLIDTEDYTTKENSIIETGSTNQKVTARYYEEAEKEVEKLAPDETAASLDNLVELGKKVYGEDFTWKKGNFYVDEQELSSLTSEELRAQVAAVMAAENFAKALEKLSTDVLLTANNFKDLSKKDAFLKLFSKDEGAALTANTINTASNFEWSELQAGAQEYFGSEEAYIDWRDEQIKLAQATLQTAQARMNRALGTTNFEFTDKDVEVGALGGLSARLEKIGYASGTQGANEVMSLIDSLSRDMTGGQKTNLYNQLSAFEWNDMSAWDDLPKILEAVGVSVPLDALDQFIAKTSALAQATYSVDFSKLVESLTDTAKIIKDIRSGAISRALDESTYEQLLKSDTDLAKQFVRNLDGEYVYLGSSMDNLADRIEDLTTEAARITRESLGEQIKVGNYLESDEGQLAKIALRGFVDRKGFQQDEVDELKNLVVDVLENSGITDYSKLGIEGFTNKTDLSTIFTPENKEFAMEIVSAIFGYATNLSTNKANAEVYDIQIAATGRQLKDASLNQGEGKGFSEALIAQATSVNINSKIIDEYKASLEKYNKITNKSSVGAVTLKKHIEALGKQIVDSTNIINRDANMAAALEGVSNLVESYENAATEEQKFAIAGQMASNFNLKVTKDNYEELGNLLSNYASGDYNSFMALVQESAEQANISIGSINATTWTEAVLEAHPVYEDFFNMLIAQGAGAFDANHKWIWTTKQEFEALAEMTGANIWENSYDWIYNYTQQVNALTREREKLERKFERTLENEVHTAAELRDITLDEVDALKRRAAMSGDAALKAQKETEALFEANSKYSDYLTYNQKTGAITANYLALNQNKNEEFGEGFDDFIGKLEELRDTYQDAVDDLEDIEDDLSELSKRGYDEYSDLIDRVQEALIQSYQDIIDERTSVSEAIKEAQDNIVNSMQEQIDAARQARDNEKTTTDLEDRRLRLAALMRDTSGGNAVEIAQLQKELTEAEEDYTDTLVDQALERLQDANEKAAEQRDKQIELAQAQLDAYSESDLSFADAQALLDKSLQSIGPNEMFGEKFMGTKAGILLNEQREAMNKVALQDWVKELQENGSLAKLYTSYHEDIQAQIDKTQEEIDAYEEKVKNIDEFLGNEEIAKRLKGNEPYSIKLEEDSKLMAEVGKISAALQNILDQMGEKLGTSVPEIDSVTITTGQAANKGYEGSHAGSVTFTPYATGGLADFTGPAWLDGTPSRPEMVLNPQDTANFIVLKDILADILVGASSTSGANKSGDNYYDIAINVDSIGDDYDVEQMADKVRDMIYSDSIYRNVNTVNRVK